MSAWCGASSADQPRAIYERQRQKGKSGGRDALGAAPRPPLSSLMNEIPPLPPPFCRSGYLCKPPPVVPLCRAGRVRTVMSASAHLPDEYRPYNLVSQLCVLYLALVFTLRTPLPFTSLAHHTPKKNSTHMACIDPFQWILRSIRLVVHKVFRGELGIAKGVGDKRVSSRDGGYVVVFVQALVLERSASEPSSSEHIGRQAERPTISPPLVMVSNINANTLHVRDVVAQTRMITKQGRRYPLDRDNCWLVGKIRDGPDQRFVVVDVFEIATVISRVPLARRARLRAARTVRH